MGNMRRSNKEECVIWDYVIKTRPDPRLKDVDKMSFEEIDRIEREEGINLRLGRVIQKTQAQMMRNPFWKERLNQYLTFLEENYPEYNKKERKELARRRLQLETTKIIWYIFYYKKPFNDAIRWLDGLNAEEYTKE